ncbi:MULTISPECIES: hypothetical protein [unclassified Streptococcus]|uniref:hypothetical protein n=1 Tax=unclassified Streptococcus TaxID=2608887 RepID=UPI001071B451|nr:MULTISPECIES: hypothetical protein [unclassified Streptococcus]MBF0787901.1 hypothetical protein [Streptococcus sp. 19428wC2_LYSM12]MCQ9212168.1 hypothetical protein [Streptococcus sp. B01]MCQ9213498.1 hypothetical protein [Streptococcus sp. O1]TFV05084.1 hypothetical protein E4T79_08435 [Streptococcus sp. LYSM12]
MSDLNQTFQQLLEDKGFPLKVKEEEDAIVYKGRLLLFEEHQVDFALSMSKGASECIAQIVFNNLATLANEDERSLWLQGLNLLNLHHGLYYYFALNEENRLFARYVTRVSGDIEDLFYILSKGGYIVERSLTFLTDYILNHKGTMK